MRLPGKRGFQLAAEQRQRGVQLHAGIMDALRPWAEPLGVAVPR